MYDDANREININGKNRVNMTIGEWMSVYVHVSILGWS